MNFRRAMTLTETLLVFIIIGIIASFTMSSLRPWERQYRDSYMRIYNVLKLALYNSMVDLNDFPRTKTSLCTKLVDYMNTAGNVTTCNPQNLGNNPADADFTVDSSIILSNGMRMWLGSKDAFTCTDDESKTCEYFTDDATGVKYYYVYIDINGDTKPNTSVYSIKKPSDIVGFALTDQYTVIPLGYPKIDIRYLQAHVVYPPEDEDSKEIVSEPMAFFTAQAMAFGYDGDATKVRSVSDPLTYVGTKTEPKEWGNGNFALDFTREDIQTLKETVVADTIDAKCAQTEDYASATEPICRVEIFNYH